MHFGHFWEFFFVENDTNSYPSTGLNTDRRASGVEKMDLGRHFTLGMIYPMNGLDSEWSTTRGIFQWGGLILEGFIRIFMVKYLRNFCA